MALKKPPKPENNVELFVIKTNFGEFKSFKEMQEYADKQYIVLQNVLQDNKALQEEVEHLKKLLFDATKIIEAEENCERIIKTPAEIACEIQLEKIQQIAMQRELSLEETKKLDLLVKNQRLMKGDSTTIEGKSKKLRGDIEHAKILEIAKGAVKKLTNESE